MVRKMIVSAILVVFLVAVSAEPCGEEPKCPQVPGQEGDLVILAVPWDCSSYIMCSYGTGIMKNCPGDLVYNPKTKVCDYPDIVKCTPCQKS